MTEYCTLIIKLDEEPKLYFAPALNFVTLLVPSEIACLASSPGKMRRTLVWISRDEMVDFLEYAASSIRLRSI